MPDYQSFMMRHSEHTMQALIEELEQSMGISTSGYESLEQRWNRVAQNQNNQ